MATIAVVSAGLREPSSTRLLADRLAARTADTLAAQGTEADVRVIELRLLARAIADAMVTGYIDPALESAFDLIAEADGLIAVTPAFNASFSGLFKSFFDVLPESSASDLPVMIAATGGTERHSLVLEHAMRPMFSYLHAIVSPTGVYAATDDFGEVGAASLSQRIDRAAQQFVRLLGSCGARVQRDVFQEDLDLMSSLLAGTGGTPTGD